MPKDEVRKFELAQLARPEYPRVTMINISPDGKSLLACSEDGVARQMDINSGKTMSILRDRNSSFVWSGTFLPDGNHAVTGDSNGLRMWDLRNQSLIRSHAWSLVNGKEYDGWFSDVDRFRPYTDMHRSVTALIVLPGGRAFLSGSTFTAIWDTATGKLVAVHNIHATALDVTPDGRMFVSSGSDCSPVLCDLSTGRVMRSFVGHTSPIRSVCISTDGRHVLTSSCAPPSVGISARATNDSTIRLWDLATAREVRRFEGHGRGVPCAKLSPDGRRVISGGFDKTVRLWDVSTGREIRCFEAHTSVVSSVAFTRNGLYAVSGSADCTIRVWALPN